MHLCFPNFYHNSAFEKEKKQQMEVSIPRSPN